MKALYRTCCAEIAAPRFSGISQRGYITLSLPREYPSISSQVDLQDAGMQPFDGQHGRRTEETVGVDGPDGNPPTRSRSDLLEARRGSTNIGAGLVRHRRPPGRVAMPPGPPSPRRSAPAPDRA